ncbi:MAG TPA: ubiquinone/menaquinone biosynthesis methyltransferase [Alphaproteobacteria bacterium]|nr:ubiquinone/menaquinone biosynthesis methyltransferase [Alphaproteobacteria bacterium]
MREPIQTATGATPPGATDERSAARAVQQMFDAIAPRYDFLNHALSMNVDRLWWRRTARAFRHILSRPGSCALDLCAGTGDMSVALRAVGPNATICALDFSPQMLQHGQGKFARKSIQPVQADALQLPVAAGHVDLVVSAFGFRNLANYDAGLREIYRVLAPGGEVGILECSQPGGLLGKLYGFYFHRVLPKIGGLISGVRGAYDYLPASVEKFPAPPLMLQKMQQAGFTEVSWTPYSFGIAGLFRGKK